MFQALRNKAKAVKRLNEKQLLKLLFLDKDLQKYVLDLNRIEQLYKRGIDAEGVTLESIGGSYTEFTVAIKQTKGQPTNRVTLKDTGDFYDSFELAVKGEGIEIKANPIKEGISLEVRWGDDIIGLADTSKEELIEKLKPLIIREVRERLEI